MEKPGFVSSCLNAASAIESKISPLARASQQAKLLPFSYLAYSAVDLSSPQGPGRLELDYSPW